jgi:hypothetical protein
MKTGYIRGPAELICWEEQRDLLTQWIRDTTSSSTSEKETSCFIVRMHPKKATPASRRFSVQPTPEKKRKFERLAQQWRDDMMFSSDTTERILHPAYQRIIGMGGDIVPLLLGLVAETHEHWFWALESITGEDPVSPDDAGDVEKISKSWVEWGRMHGFLGQ